MTLEGIIHEPIYQHPHPGEKIRTSYQSFCSDDTRTMSSSLLVSLPSMGGVSPPLLVAAHSPSISRCKEATFAPLFLKKDTTSLAYRHPQSSFGTTTP